MKVLASILRFVNAVRIGVRISHGLMLVTAQAVLSALAIAGADWQSEWEKTVKAAEQEGRVVYSGCGSHDYLGEFQKRFPKIKVESVAASCSEVVSRIMAERRAGKYLSDVLRFGLTSSHSFYRGKALQPITPAFILPEVKDESKWWQNKHHYSDPEGKYLFVSAASVYTRFASYNTSMVAPSEFKSYWDILHPKWKGKLVATDITQGEGRNGARFLYYHPELGPQFLRRLLSEMELTFSRDYRQATDWLAQKRFALYLFSQSDDTLNAKEQGLPVQILDTASWKEGVGLDPISGAFALMDKPAHPNAAKVLINWLLSRDGQIALQRDHEAAGRTDSLRIDISKSGVYPMMRRREGGQLSAHVESPVDGDETGARADKPGFEREQEELTQCRALAPCPIFGVQCAEPLNSLTQQFNETESNRARSRLTTDSPQCCVVS